jgi:hypothetical protein
MEIINEVEHEDGSATYTFDMTEEERIIMTQQGILWSIIAGAASVTPEQVFKDYIEKRDGVYEAGIQEGIDRMYKLYDICPHCKLPNGQHKPDCTRV